MKSPIKRNPLRNPGQSLDRFILDTILDHQIKYVIIGLAIWMALIFNWFIYFTGKIIPPFWFTFVGLVAFALIYFKIRSADKKLVGLRQGRDGEKAVGQYLEHLRELGYKVFHDIPGDGFNLDHVIIGKSGVYVIETKTYSKPDKGQTRIIYTGDTLIYQNGIKDDKPLVQVKAAANWLKQVIQESTGKNFDVKKVVLFPGWFIEPTVEARQSDVWVLNPKALPAFISNSRERLSEGDLNLVASHLSRFVRAHEK